MSAVDAKRHTIEAGRGALVAAVLAAFGSGGVGAQEGEIPPDYDAAIAQSGIDGSYGYFRSIEGSATLVQAGTSERVRVQPNEPILVGDRVFLSGDSRAELVLADRNIVRIGDGAELGFRALAYSGDTNDPTSLLDLARGTLQLVVARDQLGREYPSVITPNASMRALEDGSYLVVVDDGFRTEVVVRQGRAEVLTDGQNAEVRPGESLFVEGTRGQNLQWAAAPSLDRLERWGEGLAVYDASEYGGYVADDLHYSAASLRGHGAWIHVGGGYAWRPHVAVGWAPYRDGRWRYTPSGLFWISYEPWGWVPYHYGYWDHHTAYGWIWYPGRRFAAAHVYWYWGPQYVGWVPSGYYWRHYGSRYGGKFGFYFGVYGHIGGGWGPYRHWTFLPSARLGHRRQHFYAVNGFELGRRRAALERGVLLTDTRSLRPDAWRRPAETLAGLRRATSRDGRELPDARAFVERVPRLPERLERVALEGRDARSAGAVLSGGGSARGRDAAARPSVEARRLGTVSERLEGRANPGRVTGRDARSAGRAVGEPVPETLRRPGASGTRSDRLQRPDRSPTVDRGAASTRPAVRPPVARRTQGRTLLRPERSEARPEGAARPEIRSTGPAVRRAPASRPAVRPGAPDRSRPTARPATPERSRPTARPGGGDVSRPAVRPSTRSSSRPAVRPSTRSSSRPAARPSTRSSSRPAARPSTRSSSRPAVRPSTRSSSRPVVRPSTRRSSQPAVRPSTRSTSRPAVRPSTRGSSRPTARPATPSSSRPAVRPSTRRSSQPAVRPSTRSTSRPAVRPSTRSSSRPAVRPSTRSSSRPAVRPSTRGSSRPMARPATRSSSRPAVRSGGGSSRPSVSRSSGSRSRPSARSGSTRRRGGGG